MSDTVRFLAFVVLAISAFVASRSASPADRRTLFILGCAAAALGLLLLTDWLNLGDSIELVSTLIIGIFVLLSGRTNRGAAEGQEESVGRSSGT